jgi:hypothetical protein
MLGSIENHSVLVDLMNCAWPCGCRSRPAATRSLTKSGCGGLLHSVTEGSVFDQYIRLTTAHFERMTFHQAPGLWCPLSAAQTATLFQRVCSYRDSPSESVGTIEYAVNVQMYLQRLIDTLDSTWAAPVQRADLVRRQSSDGHCDDCGPGANVPRVR